VTISEKSLSKLKIIENYKKNSIGQTILNPLATLDIEKTKQPNWILINGFCKSKEHEQDFVNYHLTERFLLKITHVQNFRKLSCHRQQCQKTAVSSMS
jgi:hypothetical protein